MPGILFAEQRHRAAANRVFDRHDVGIDFHVAQNLFVDQPLDFLHLFVSHLLIMREVKAQIIRRHD